MNELKRRIGRREAVRIAILGALAILAGCEEKQGDALGEPSTEKIRIARSC